MPQNRDVAMNVTLQKNLWGEASQWLGALFLTQASCPSAPNSCPHGDLPAILVPASSRGTHQPSMFYVSKGIHQLPLSVCPHRGPTRTTNPHVPDILLVSHASNIPCGIGGSIATHRDIGHSSQSHMWPLSPFCSAFLLFCACDLCISFTKLPPS